MKQIFLVLILFICCVSVNGQTDKGNWLVGGNAGFVSANNSSTYYINPNFGYFFTNRLAAGLSLFYYNSGNSTFSLGPFMRGYLMFGDAARLFGQVRFPIGVSSYRDATGIKQTDSNVGLGAGPGFAIFIKENVALDILFEYFIPDLSNNGYNLGLNIGFQVHL